MAAFKKKKVIQKEIPKEKYIVHKENPEKYFDKKPSWRFNQCDNEWWPFTKQNIGESFWDEIFPKLKNLETQTWNEILNIANKQNHFVKVDTLHSEAQKRLAQKQIEYDSIVSLRLNGTHRLYGYIVGSTFHIIWCDFNHGDNSTCVCRSHRKHT
jgi:hypothetical protein